jgi:hypothetical protein
MIDAIVVLVLPAIGVAFGVCSYFRYEVGYK